MGTYLTRTGKHAKPEVSLSSTGEPAESDYAINPVIARSAVAVKYMISKGQNSSGAKAGTMRIVTKIVTEALSDASDVPPAIAEFYMKQLAAMIWWTATGEALEGMPLPEDFTV
jgi:hypothetical protein